MQKMTPQRRQQKRADNARARVLANGTDVLFKHGFYANGCPKPKNVRRRNSCSKDLEKFALTYFPHICYLEMSEGQRREIQIMEQVILQGGTYALAAPRGDGKTSRVEIGTIWAALYGYRKFAVPVGADQAGADAIMDTIKNELLTNELLTEDFPEVCVIAQWADGSPHKAKTALLNGKNVRMIWAAKEMQLPTIEGSASSGGLIKPRGITGAIRGMKHNPPDGGSPIRPNLFLFDDPQTDESAKSPTQCSTRSAIVNGAALGSGGPTDRIAAFMPCTVIHTDDMASQFLDRKEMPQWHGTCRAMIVDWPDDFEQEDTTDSLWLKYHEMRQEDFRKDMIEPKNANKFYADNQKAMDKGSRMDNPARIMCGDLSALQSAMNLYFDRGRTVFMAEYQNQPEDMAGSVYDIDKRLICSRVNGFKRYEMPPQAKFVVCMADINYIGLNYAVVAFDNDFTAWIIDYGKFPGGKRWLIERKTAESEVSRKIAQGIKSFHAMIKDKPFNQNGKVVDLGLTLIDCNMWTETAVNAIHSLRQGRAVLGDRGTPASRYRYPAKANCIGKPGNNYHIEKGPKGNVQVRHNSDYWRMTAQKAFLLQPGVPGSLSLWGNEPAIHEGFAIQVCAERLLQHIQAEPNHIYQWRMQPGTPNDLLDALVGCYPAAGALGAVMPGAELKPVTRTSRQNKAKQERKQPSRPRSKGGIRRNY